MTARPTDLPTVPYIFFRMHEGREYFYPVCLYGDEDVIPNVECNPGTIRVEDMNGNVKWRLQ